MRSIQRCILLISSIAICTQAAGPSCQGLCDSVTECANDPQYHGSYCKDWQTIPVCFGMYTRADGSLCFQPNDPTCDDLVLSPVGCSSQIVTTTVAPTSEVPTTVEPTTVAPTTVAPTPIAP